MHREIVKAKNGLVVDHWNHDSWIIDKENLRECTHAENSSNMSVIKRISTLNSKAYILTRLGGAQ